MKIKKRLKYKSTLPKADYSMDPNALSNMNKQAAEETPAQGGGMGAAGAMGMATQGLNLVSSFMPKDNDDGIGVSHKGSAISKGISGGLKAGADMARAVPGFGTIAAAAMDAGAAITDMVTGWVDKVREKDRTKVSRSARLAYDPTNNNTGYSFGTPQVPTSQPMFGGQAKYGMPLFGDGGSMKYNTNFRPATSYEQKYNKETGLWEVGGAKPKQTTTTKKTVPQKVTPIYTSDPNDKRLKMYQDSLSLFNKGEKDFKFYNNVNAINNIPKSSTRSWSDPIEYNGLNPTKIQPIQGHGYYFNHNPDVVAGTNVSSDKVNNKVFRYKKPVQPVIYKKNDVRVPVPKINFNNLKEKQDILGDNIQYQNEPVQEESKGKPLNDFLKQERKNPNGGINTYIRKDIKSPWLQKDFALGGFINKNRINNSLSNGMFSPDGKFFSSPEQYQQYQSFYNPQPQLQQPIMNNYGTLKMKSNFRNNSFFELGGDPRSQSNIEAEQGEAMQHSSGKIEAIGGKKHPNGGTPLIVQPSHEYIYSDSLGKDKNGNITLNEKDVVRSFADDAKSIQKKYSSREGDPIVDKTKELELSFLKQDAEQARVAKEEIEMGKQMKKYKAKYGANLKRFDTSGDPQQPSSIQPSSIMTPEEMKKMYDDLHLKAAGVTGGLNQTITDLQQTSKQLDNTNQQLQQSSTSLTKPTINKPLYNTLDTGDYFYEPTKLQTSWGTYGTDGNLIQKQSVIQPTPQPLFGGGNRINPFVGPRVPSRRDNLREAANFYTPGQVGTPKPMAQAQDRQEDIAPDAVKKNGFFGDLTTGDKMQLASMLPAFGFNMGMGLRKADVEPNRKNPYENDVLSMMANRKFDIQNYLNQSNLATNTAKEDIGNNSTSVGGKMANLQKLFANQLGTLGDITTKGQEMNNQYRAEEANTKNIIGEANRAESIRAAGINDQNKARKQQFLAKAFEQLGQGIATTGQSANQSLTNKLLIKSLSEISPDFDVKNMKDMEVDNDGYIVFKGQKTEFKMSDEGKIVMASGTPNTANAAKSQYAPKDFTMKAFANFTKPKKK